MRLPFSTQGFGHSPCFFEHDPLLLAVAESKDPETELLVLCWVGEWLERVPSLLQP